MTIAYSFHCFSLFQRVFPVSCLIPIVKADLVHSNFINIIKVVHKHYKISEKYRKAERRLKIPIFLLPQNHFTVYLACPYSITPPFKDIFGINDLAPMIKNNSP